MAVSQSYVNGYVNADIVEVASSMGLQFIKQAPNGEYIFRCPFCYDSQKHIYKGHLYLKRETGEWHCARCGRGGYTISLYALMRGISNSEAYKEIAASTFTRVASPPPARQAAKDDKSILSDEQADRRNAVYGAFLQMLSLSPRHKKDLLRRGLSSDDIAAKGFKSLPDNPMARWNICRELSNKYPLDGIPGFEQRTSRKGTKYWDCPKAPGYLIPIRDPEGRIIAFQIRRDNPGALIPYAAGEVKVTASYVETDTGEIIETSISFAVPGPGASKGGITVPVTVPGKPVRLRFVVGGQNVTGKADWTCRGPAVIGPGGGKYVWFSTPGSPVKAVPHVANPGLSRRVWITEGPLKAEVASKFLKVTFVGVPGVGVWRPVQNTLDRLKAESYVLAYDEDSREKTRAVVQMNAANLMKSLQEAGYTGEVATWDQSLGKGIDDAVLTLCRRKVEVTEQTFLSGVVVKKTTTQEIEVKIPAEKAESRGFLSRILHSIFG